MTWMRQSSRIEPCEAACFDLDGTLIDTEPVHLAAESQCLALLGVDPCDGCRPRTFGLGIDAGMRRLSKAYGLDETGVLGTYLRLWETGLHTTLKLLPGADLVLTWLAGRGIPLALVTSGDAQYVNLVNSVLDLRRHFQAIVTADQVEATKPDPLPYQMAAERLERPWDTGVAPSMRPAV